MIVVANTNMLIKLQRYNVLALWCINCWWVWILCQDKLTHVYLICLNHFQAQKAVSIIIGCGRDVQITWIGLTSFLKTLCSEFMHSMHDSLVRCVLPEGSEADPESPRSQPSVQDTLVDGEGLTNPGVIPTGTMVWSNPVAEDLHSTHDDTNTLC